MTKPTAFVTTPIYYPSGNPHIGSAYTTIAADVYARFKRLDGFDVKFSTGTDEHGLKIQRAAEKLGQAPQAYLDDISQMYRRLGKTLNISDHDFIRTTDARHEQAATHMWHKLNEAGYIYKDTYAGWYSVQDETFYTEEELVGGKSPDSGHPVEWVEEESYYFKLSAFTDKLLAYYTAHPDFILPKSRANEVISFVKGGLKDLAISRSTFSWGVPVPGDSKHVMYVWIDALTNYLTVCGWPDAGYTRYWPAIHLVGKDILRFHAVYWPAMLMAVGVALPKCVFAHGFWVANGEKMSKSKGNVVDPFELSATLGVDQMRYYLMREIAFGQDGDFNRANMVRRINTELANDLGNLFQRVLSMVFKNCAGQTPALGTLTAEDKAFLALAGAESLAQYRTHVDRLEFHKALDVVWQLIGAANRYMDAQKPWSLKKEDPTRMAHVLRVLMEVFCPISLMVEPFMPASAENLRTQTGFTGTTFAALEKTGPWLADGTPIPQPQGVFMRIADEDAA